MGHASFMLPFFDTTISRPSVVRFVHAYIRIYPNTYIMNYSDRFFLTSRSRARVFARYGLRGRLHKLSQGVLGFEIGFVRSGPAAAHGRELKASRRMGDADGLICPLR
jgi:hypothetical protein